MDSYLKQMEKSNYSLLGAQQKKTNIVFCLDSIVL